MPVKSGYPRHPTRKRKNEHLENCRLREVEFQTKGTWLDHVHFVHSAVATVAPQEQRDPERSVIFHRMATREPFAQMPPLGTKLVDSEGAQLISQWISSHLN